MNVLVYFCPACLSSVILVGEGEKRLQVHANQREAVEPTKSLDSGTNTNWESGQRGFNYGLRKDSPHYWQRAAGVTVTML